RAAGKRLGRARTARFHAVGRARTRPRAGTTGRRRALERVMTTNRYTYRGAGKQLRRPQGRPDTLSGTLSGQRATRAAGYGSETSPSRAGEEGSTMILLRREIGDVLRDARQRQG